MSRHAHIDRVLKDIREVWMVKPELTLMGLLIEAKDAKEGHNDITPGDHECFMFRYRLCHYWDKWLLDGIASLRKKYGIDPNFSPPTKPADGDDDELLMA